MAVELLAAVGFAEGGGAGPAVGRDQNAIVPDDQAQADVFFQINTVRQPEAVFRLADGDDLGSTVHAGGAELEGGLDGRFGDVPVFQPASRVVGEGDEHKW